MPSTSVFAEMETLVICENAKVAVSAGPLGTLVGVQLSGVFQSPEVGSNFHSALSAWAKVAIRNVRPEPINDAISLFIKVILQLLTLVYAAMTADTSPDRASSTSTAATLTTDQERFSSPSEWHLYVGRALPNVPCRY